MLYQVSSTLADGTVLEKEVEADDPLLAVANATLDWERTFSNIDVESISVVGGDVNAIGGVS